MSARTWTGKLLGKYEMGELIGQGGTAQVYKARHPALRRDVAVKVIHPHLPDREGFLERFQREAQTAGYLRYPNIVQVFDFGAHDGVSYMVMELIEGPTLARRLEQLASQRIVSPLDEAVDLLITLCGALDYAHARGMVHSDVKPGNVMLTGQGEPVLTDLGLAKIVGGTTATATGAVIGTPIYVSPSQACGRAGNGASDIYSLGVVLFELATGVPPFEGDTPLSIITKHINQPLPSARPVNPRVPQAIEAVSEKATAKSPDERYRSCAEMSAALRVTLHNQQLPGTEPVLPSPPSHAVKAQEQAAPAAGRRPAYLDGLPAILTQVLGPVGKVIDLDRFIKALGEEPNSFPAARLP